MRLTNLAPFLLKRKRTLDGFGSLHTCLDQQIAHQGTFRFQGVIRCVMQLHTIRNALGPAIRADVIESRRELSRRFRKQLGLCSRGSQLDTYRSLYMCIVPYMQRLGKERTAIPPHA